jgi:hypothetical protein
MALNSTVQPNPAKNTLITVKSTAHPYLAADVTTPTWVAPNGTDLTVKANWVNDTQADCMGLLVAIVDANTIQVCTNGESPNNYTTLTDDATYFGGITPGVMSLTPAAASGNVIQPLATVNGPAAGPQKIFVRLGARTLIS